MQCPSGLFKKFRRSGLYQNTKLECGLAPTSSLPGVNWSLTRGLMKREYGLASPAFNGNFSLGQQRSIVSSYPPNQWSKTLLEYNFRNYPIVDIILCRFDKNGDKLLVASTEGAHIIRARNGEYRLLRNYDLGGSRFWISGADISSCGELIACYISVSNTIILNRTDDSVERELLRLHGQNIFQEISPLCFMPCNKKLVGSFRTSSFLVIDIETKNIQDEVLFNNKFSWHCSYTMKVLEKLNPHVIACGHSYSGSLRIFDLRCYPQYVKKIRCHRSGITSIDAHNDGNHILTNSKDNCVRIWDIRKSYERFHKQIRNFVMSFRGHYVETLRQQAKFSPYELTGHRYIYAGSSWGKISIYDLITGQYKQTSAVETPDAGSIITSLDWHPQRNDIISGSNYSINLNVYKEDDPVTNEKANNSLENGLDKKDESFWSKLQRIG